RRGATARVCLEATGVYSLCLALALQRAERMEVMVVNPRAIKDFQRARLTRAKTDRVDALGILEFLRRMAFVPLDAFCRCHARLAATRSPAGPTPRHRVHSRSRRTHRRR